jgi:hypothetical protein
MYQIISDVIVDQVVSGLVVLQPVCELSQPPLYHRVRNTKSWRKAGAVKQTSERIKGATRERRRGKECDELEEKKKPRQELLRMGRCDSKLAVMELQTRKKVVRELLNIRVKGNLYFSLGSGQLKVLENKVDY